MCQFFLSVNKYSPTHAIYIPSQQLQNENGYVIKNVDIEKKNIEKEGCGF